eukprot:6194648-Pleurochrysis_carterae.AAC.2
MATAPCPFAPMALAIGRLLSMRVQLDEGAVALPASLADCSLGLPLVPRTPAERRSLFLKHWISGES